MKIDPLSVLLDNNYKLDKKFYFISGNEVTLMDKIKSTIIKKYQQDQDVQITNIDTIKEFVDEAGLFENKKIYICNNCKGVDEENLKKIQNSSDIFIFVQENSQKTKKIKNLFNKNKDSYLIDCYELNIDSKIRVLNKFINDNKVEIGKDVYSLLIDKLDTKYIFLESSLSKISTLKNEDITINNIRKILTINDGGKEKIFFNLLRKNKDIITMYKDKVQNNSDAYEVYYYCKYFCQLIIDCNNEDQYNKKIPIYLFREKNYLIDIYKRYNSGKKKMLLKLLSSTEKMLRKESGLSLMAGLRFVLNIKKITIS